MPDSPDSKLVPPHSQEAEVAVLGAILLKPEVMPAVLPLLEPDMFYRADHGAVYEAMRSLYADESLEDGKPIDLLLVKEALRFAGRDDLADNVDLFLMLSGAVPSLANAVWYARIVRRKAVFRQLISVAGELLMFGYREQADSVDRAQHMVREVAIAAETVTPLDPVTQLGELVDRVRDGGLEQSVLATGIGKLDVVTHGGFRRGELWVIGGRPSTGKSSLALNLLMYGLRKGYRTAFFSLEVTTEQLLGNLVACTAEVDSQLWRVKNDDIRWDRVQAARAELTSGAVGDALRECVIDDAAHLSPSQLRAKCLRATLDGPLDYIIVDHIQLMAGDGKAKDSREYERVSEASRALKLLAKELDCVVIALSQLNRASVGDARAPRLDDLRASGTIEQDADAVLLMHDEPKDAAGDERRHDIILAKQRHGPKRILKMVFVREWLRFYPYQTEGEADDLVQEEGG